MGAAALAVVPAAHAASYKGTVAGGTIGNDLQGESANTSVVFDCNDPKQGHFDICVDVDFTVVRPYSSIYMDAKFNPKIAVPNPNILMRYSFTQSTTNHLGNNPNKTVDVFTTGWANQAKETLKPLQTLTVSMYTHDGGNTWSRFRIDNK